LNAAIKIIEPCFDLPELTGADHATAAVTAIGLAEHL
jgi:hypothetical protein